jgi:hypothetical protein
MVGRQRFLTQEATAVETPTQRLYPRFLQGIAAAALALLATGCTSIGPATVPQDRINYETAIGDSWKAQTLLNIVKLRYADFPVFLEVSQVIAGYQMQSTVGASFTAGNVTAGLVGPVTASGTAAAAGTYTDRPTVIYSPLTGVDFLKRLMTPVPPSSVLFMLQSGYSAERIMPIMLDAINGLNNRSNRSNRPADPGFIRAVQLIREGQIARALQFRIEPSKQGAESSLLVFGPNPDPEIAAKGQELRKLLGLKPDLMNIKIFYGGYTGKDDEIDIATRSMLEIMLEMAANVEVPQADVSQGKASPGRTDAQAGEPAQGPKLRVLNGDAQPKDAYVAVQYGRKWFWIADTDIESKSTFGVVMLMFSATDTGVRGAAPVVTVPAQ